MLWSRPTADDLKGTGLRPSHYTEPMVECWPDIWPALMLYNKNRTQTLPGFNGPTGLNYLVFHGELDRKGLQGDEREEVMDHLRTIEAEMLKKVYKDMEARQAKK